ncbi:MAG: hypothetical protein K8W52_29370, partial [Deltaproteobacteria bacterium]|nr:hypothetical protein [Deltaproteobacteria bacterium]
RRPPDQAMYYLAAIRYGHAYDAVIEGDAIDMGTSLEATFSGVGVSVGQMVSSGKYKVYQRGLGLKPSGGGAIFVSNPDQIQNAYTADGPPVPVELILHLVPGRRPRHGARDLAPEPLLDLEVSIGERESYEAQIPPGSYAWKILTRDKGVDVSWSDSGCRGGTFRMVDGVCRFRTTTTLRVFNDPGLLGSGPSERTHIYVERR